MLCKKYASWIRTHSGLPHYLHCISIFLFHITENLNQFNACCQSILLHKHFLLIIKYHRNLESLREGTAYFVYSEQFRKVFVWIFVLFRQSNNMNYLSLLIRVKEIESSEEFCDSCFFFFFFF